MSYDKRQRVDTCKSEQICVNEFPKTSKHISLYPTILRMEGAAFPPPFLLVPAVPSNPWEDHLQDDPRICDPRIQVGEQMRG